MTVKNPVDYNNYMKQYMLKRYHERRQQAFERLGNKCVVCGSQDNLEIDHIDPVSKSIEISKLWSIKIELFWQEIAKCQLLCNDHHKLKSINEGSFDNRDRLTTCECGEPFTTIKAFAGHKRWCEIGRT